MQNKARGEVRAPVIVTVHGTHDSDGADVGTRWWQVGSAFTDKLIARLAAAGVAGAEIVPVHWSGENSDHERLVGANTLARLLKKLRAERRPHAVVAHSHGGNVAMEALAARLRVARPAGVVTFGSPFFARRLKPIPWLIAVFQVVFGIMIGAAMIMYLVTSLASDTNKKVEAGIFFGGLLIVAILSLIKGLRNLNWNRIARRRARRAIAGADWLVVHSPRDEAMRLLESAIALSPAYVTVASARRTLMRFATVLGVVGTSVFLAITAPYFLRPIIEKISAASYGAGMVADLTFVLVLPVVYGAIYAVCWVLIRLGGDRLYAALLNLLIHGGLMGAAFGSDSRFVFPRVSRVPPYVEGTVERRIVAADLGGIDEAAIFQSAQEFYAGIVAEDAAEVGFGDPDKLWKRLSDALYHNAYMRDEAVIGAVAEHLAARLRG